MLIVIIGSAPDALEARSFKREFFDGLVVINNAWNIRDDWDYCIFPDDFPESRRPHNNKNQRLIGSAEYVRYKISTEGLFILEEQWHLQPVIGP